MYLICFTQSLVNTCSQAASTHGHSVSPCAVNSHTWMHIQHTGADRAELSYFHTGQPHCESLFLLLLPYSPPSSLLSHHPTPLLDPESSAFLCWAVPCCTFFLERSSSTHMHPPGLSWWSSGEDSMLPLQGALKLRSHMPQGVTKGKKKKICTQVILNSS